MPSRTAFHSICPYYRCVIFHYDIPKEHDRIYEIEPTIRRYASYLKGYAGFSSLLFLASIVLYFVTAFGPERCIDALFSIIIP